MIPIPCPTCAQPVAVQLGDDGDGHARWAELIELPPCGHDSDDIYGLGAAAVAALREEADGY